jgi:hypothetical protein
MSSPKHNYKTNPNTKSPNVSHARGARTRHPADMTMQQIAGEKCRLRFVTLVIRASLPVLSPSGLLGIDSVEG